MTNCGHLEGSDDLIIAKTRGCEECEKENEKWEDLRICLKCGHVGCCDLSSGRHATRHFQKTGHAVMAAFPTRKWKWCFIDNEYV
ncbi:MAG: UBP-type zinc finger domain-containing protein [Candidatus Micrarchaeaceae archaeon]|jgi:uncharacterized UBP type Zn finger protein